MTAFSCDAFLTQHDKSTNQIKQLQRDVDDSTRKLEEIQQKRLQTEEEVTQCTREAERRVDLLKDKTGIVDLLQQLGKLLQKERQINEQLDCPPPADRNQWRDLQETNERVTNKARTLTAEIVEVKQRLGEAEAQFKAAQALISAPTTKSKRNQSKHK